ncbi:hypothetical protein ACKUB1_13840 [Methanospirillum stamsii]|uniref:DUF2190 domain-containing protein n=1 Tax=Methanospirillum stamsii TaxID=1277351 RepID=A0A2V2N3U3_9EURY|nr:hypothetical protein [Methanospirillum stamsii]PWR74814.1 hypothetical protein DLD82_07920 [Methanospirillum stamsii]
MAVGDIKGEEAIVQVLTAGAAVAKGDVVHLESDGKWDPVVATDKGKFAVAIEAASGDAVEFRAVVWGRVEVTATAATIAAWQNVIAGSTGKIAKAVDMVALDAPASYAEAGVQTELDKIQDPRIFVGTVTEAFGSGATGTLWVGLVA